MDSKKRKSTSWIRRGGGFETMESKEVGLEHGFEGSGLEEGFEAMDSKEMDSKEVGSKHGFEPGRAHGTLNLNRSYLPNR